MKRVLVVGDFHCGHELALTHPDFDSKPNDIDSPRYKNYKMRRDLWSRYESALEELQPVDIMIGMGDFIDGKGEASEGTEQLTTKIGEQVGMAVACIQAAKAKEIYLVRGTSYHTTKQDNEDDIAKTVGAAKIGDHDYIRVTGDKNASRDSGLIFDYAHEVGGGALPINRFAPLARERLLNMLWAEHDEYPKAHVILRGHRHYYAYCGEPGWIAMTVPGMQMSSKFGRRKIRYTIHTGLVYFDVENKDDFSWDSIIWRVHKKSQELIEC